MMETTHTKAGLLADAGAARLRAAAPAASYRTTAASCAPSGARMHQVIGQHVSSSWTMGAAAIPTTFMVLDGKNRPTRPLLERSP
jgi:hypothetical protein